MQRNILYKLKIDKITVVRTLKSKIVAQYKKLKHFIFYISSKFKCIN